MILLSEVGEAITSVKKAVYRNAEDRDLLNMEFIRVCSDQFNALQENFVRKYTHKANFWYIKLGNKL